MKASGPLFFFFYPRDNIAHAVSFDDVGLDQINENMSTSVLMLK